MNCLLPRLFPAIAASLFASQAGQAIAPEQATDNRQEQQS
jgi:hypothetical protein